MEPLGFHLQAGKKSAATRQWHYNKAPAGPGGLDPASQSRLSMRRDDGRGLPIEAEAPGGKGPGWSFLPPLLALCKGRPPEMGKRRSLICRAEGCLGVERRRLHATPAR